MTYEKHTGQEDGSFKPTQTLQEAERVGYINTYIHTYIPMVENKVVDRQQKGRLYEVSQLIPSEHLLPPTDLVSSPLPTAADNFTLSTFKQPHCFAKPKTLNSSSQGEIFF